MARQKIATTSGSDHDVEAVLTRVAVAGSTERHDDVAQRAIVHVQHALPRDPAHVYAEFVAVVDMVVEQRREQIVGELDGVEVAGEVQIDVFHRHDLGVTAAGRPALHAEYRAQAGFAQCNQRLLADPVQRVVPSPTVVVVLPSPAGVGLIAVTRTSLPSGRFFRLSRYASESLAL